MPIYGDEKRLQMVRSILPSSRAKGARDDLAHIKRRSRSRINQVCHKLTIDPEFWDDETSAYDYPDREIRYVVRTRRAADKLRHFEKWAIHITKNKAKKDRLSYMKGILPGGLIGQHAVEHLENYDEFNLDECRYGRRRSYEPAPPTDWAALLRQIVIDNDRHRAFNKWMNEHHTTVQWTTGFSTVQWTSGRFGPQARLTETRVSVGPERPRLLGGLGDIESFLQDISMSGVPRKVESEPWFYKTVFPRNWSNPAEGVSLHESTRTTRSNPDYHPEWWSAMASFQG